MRAGFLIRRATIAGIPGRSPRINRPRSESTPFYEVVCCFYICVREPGMYYYVKICLRRSSDFYHQCLMSGHSPQPAIRAGTATPTLSDRLNRACSPTALAFIPAHRFLLSPFSFIKLNTFNHVLAGYATPYLSRPPHRMLSSPPLRHVPSSV